jgi:hypothetical protein
VGGTYFVTRPNTATADEHDDVEAHAIAVYKPIDEEPGAPNNPKQAQLQQSNFVPMLPWGGGARREVAAYKIGGALADVPETYYIECETDQGTLPLCSWIVVFSCILFCFPSVFPFPFIFFILFLFISLFISLLFCLFLIA